MTSSTSSPASSSLHVGTPAGLDTRRESEATTLAFADEDVADVEKQDKKPSQEPHAADDDKFKSAGRAEGASGAADAAAAAGDEKGLLVTFDDDDGHDPQSWSIGYRAFCTFQLAMLAMVASLGSSIISPAQGVLADKFALSEELTTFTVSLYVFGFAFGPLLWAGLSETFGRKWSLLPAVFGLGIFSIGSAVSNTAAALFVTRFFGGIFGSGPVSNVGASLGDMYKPKERGVAVSLYAIAVIGGPTLGTVIGAALTQKVSWRWTEYLIAICALAFCAFSFCFLPETYAPVILKRKAQRLRKQTGNEGYFHPHENVKLDPKSILTKQVARPLLMLFTEPIVTVIAVYASFVYALLYMSLEIFPLIFGQIRRWGPIVSTLPFLAMFIGILFALTVNLGNAHFYNKAVDRAGGKPVPEARLPPMIVGAVCFTTGLFWLGWTAEPRFHWINPVIASAFIGGGFNMIFQQCINFLIDTYRLYAASAVSANTFLRSILGATLPFAVRPMFQALGPGKSLSILGAFAAVAIPIPFLFMKIGKSLRQRSKFAPV